MTSETFEQILTAAEADGSFNPAWKKFVNTKFFVPVVRKPGADAKGFSLHVGHDGGQVIKISEVRERLEQPPGGVLASLSGADVVRLLHAEADILVALSDRAFSIAKDRVDWLKKGIEAAQARANAKAAEAAAPATVAPASPSSPPFPTLAPVPAPAAPVAPRPAPVSIAKPEPTLAPIAPAVPRRQGGVLDIAALKPRPVALEKVGLEFFVPGDWREVQSASGMQFTDEAGGTVVKASGSHRPGISLTKWQGMSMQLVQHEMRYLTQDGEPYAIDGDNWRDRVKGLATEFTGTFPGDDGPSRYLVACIRIDGTVASITIRARAEVFEQNRALYKWLLGRVDINEAAAAAARAPLPVSKAGAADLDELPEYPGWFGMSLTGRISRLQALAYSFPIWAPFIVVAILSAVVMPKKPFLGGAMIISALVATLWLAMRLLVLRLHDANISGKWILAFIGVSIVAMVMRNPLIGGLVIGGGWLASLVFYCLVPGTPDDNDYGPPPGENTMLVKIGATLFILLQLSAIGGGGKMRNSPGGLMNPMVFSGSGGARPATAIETFMPDDASLMVDMPGTPEQVQIPMQMRNQLGGGRMQMYQLSANGHAYMVQVLDFGSATIDHAGAMDGMQKSIVGNDGALIESKMILMNGFKGREVRVKLPGEMVRAARFVIVGAKIRAVMIVAGTDPASTAHIDSYLASFRLPQ